MAVNLNLLSSDFFSLLVGLVVFKYKVSSSYCLHVIVIVTDLLRMFLHQMKIDFQLTNIYIAFNNLFKHSGCLSLQDIKNIAFYCHV